MVIKYNVTGADRKRLVTALSKITGVKAKYLGMPSMAYEVGDFIIDKNGTLELTGKAGSEEIESVAERLASEGFTPEEETKGTEAAQTADSGAFGLCISMPRNSFTDTALENVKAIIQVKGELIRHALRLDDLPIKISEEKSHFLGLKKCLHQKRYKRIPTLFQLFVRWQGIKNASWQKKRKLRMRNIHSDAFYCALALSEKNIRKNGKYCLET